ncbi:MAG: helix-turn-helix domain-containing protein [Lactobacillus sp.]|jgi:hypothetical protein|nr:helix-turn-helix domain-containing protein [Lactobacillus sp.]MCI2032093.1 helix-turn-helix domain-containing protein [Lactobacillus sp.]
MAESLLAKTLGRTIRAVLRDELVIMAAEWLDTEHAITLLQGTKYTLLELRKKGLPCRRIGRKVYFSKTDINSFIARQKR